MEYHFFGLLVDYFVKFVFDILNASFEIFGHLSKGFFEDICLFLRLLYFELLQNKF